LNGETFSFFISLRVSFVAVFCGLFQNPVNTSLSVLLNVAMIVDGAVKGMWNETVLPFIWMNWWKSLKNVIIL
jgi:hypothetical protein